MKWILFPDSKRVKKCKINLGLSILNFIISCKKESYWSKRDDTSIRKIRRKKERGEKNERWIEVNWTQCSMTYAALDKQNRKSRASYSCIRKTMMYAYWIPLLYTLLKRQIQMKCCPSIGVTLDHPPNQSSPKPVHFMKRLLIIISEFVSWWDQTIDVTMIGICMKTNFLVHIYEYFGILYKHKCTYCQHLRFNLKQFLSIIKFSNHAINR